MSPRPARFVLAAVLGLICAAARADVATIGVLGDSVRQPKQNGAVLTFALTREGDTTYRVAVAHETEDGTALATREYRAVSGIAVIDAGASTAGIPVRVLNGKTTIDKTFTLRLLSAVGIGPLPAFTAQQAFAVGDNPRAVGFADVNTDGKPDLVVANRDADTVSILLNATAAAATMPTFAAQQAFAAGNDPTAIVLADLNTDGKPDLIVAYGPDNDSEQVSVLLNTTAAGSATVSFAGAQGITVGDTPSAIVAADLNADGKPDLVAANKVDNTLSVLINATASGAAAASFAAQQVFATQSAPAAVVAADLNSDGSPDLAVTNQQSASLSVFFNATANGAPAATLGAAQHIGSMFFGGSLKAGDLNQDGRIDLIGANGLDFSFSSAAALLNLTAPGATTAVFSARQGLNYSSMSWADMADFNGDSRPDVFTSSDSVLESWTDAGAAALTLGPPVSLATGTGAAAIGIHDLNADGKPDLVTANAAADTVSVLLNAVADSAFDTQYDAVIGVAEATGTIMPNLNPVGGHGGSSMAAWALLFLLGAVIFRYRTARRSARASRPV